MEPTSLISQISAARIARFAGSRQARRCEIKLITETGSTNTDLLEYIATGKQTMPVLLVAKTQTAGRGRAGRSWLTSPLSALTFSLAWPFSISLQVLVSLPLVVGVAIAETLADFGVEVQLKWPNDILQDGGKLAGILVETITILEKTWAVIGIGINIALSEELQENIQGHTANLTSELTQDYDLLLGSLLRKLTKNIKKFESKGLVVFIERWNQLHAFNNKEVLILDQGKIVYEGKLLGIDQTGRLLLRTVCNGLIYVASGDISLRSREI